MIDKLKTAVCGLGGMGVVCARALRMSDRAQLASVASRREDVARKYGAELKANWYTDCYDMLEREELDAIFIMTPQYMHAEQSIAAMDRGLHVFCTKPMAVTLREADSMIEAARKNKIKLEIGFHYRFDNQIIKMKEIIDNGEIGRVFSTVTSIQSFRGPDYWAQGPWRSRLDQAGGGALTLNYSHDIDYLQWYFGPVEWVCGRVDTMVHSVEVEDVATAIIRFERGVLSTFTCSTATMASKSPRLEVFGTAGTISLVTEESKDPQFPYPTSHVMLYKQGEWKPTPVSGSIEIARRWEGKLMPWTLPLKGLSSIESLVAHIDEFLKCISEDREPSVTGEEGRRVMEIIQAIYTSSRNGKVVEL